MYAEPGVLLGLINAEKCPRSIDGGKRVYEPDIQQGAWAIVYNIQLFTQRVVSGKAGNDCMLKVTNLTCARGEQQLFSNLCFELHDGGLLQVLGENGSGKTTLLRTLCGFTQPLSGEIFWREKNIRTANEKYHADIIYLGHHNAIKDDLSALENLRISCTLSDCEVSDSVVIAALRHMGLRGRETFLVKVLSQGQRRRVALARLLLSKAPLWILDEPLAALDAEAAGLIQDLIAKHLKNRGMVIYTTHQTLEVAGTEVQRLSLS